MLDSNVPQPWRARTTLVLTLSLLAIGLGNLQRMPYLIGEHGGGVFFLSYVLALLLLSVPVLIGEVIIGSLGRGSPGLAQINAGVTQKGQTCVCTALYWKGHLVKARIDLAQGKKLHDKRETEKDRDWQRQKARIVRDNVKQ